MAEHGRDDVRPIDRSSRFGNPFKLEEDGGDHTRQESIAKYRERFEEKIRDPEFREAVEDLRGETLGCWCKPEDCHGDVILEYLDSQPESTQTTEAAATDPGEIVQVTELVQNLLVDGVVSEPITAAAVAGKVEAAPETVEHALETLANRPEPLITPAGGGEYRYL
jgi:hypothetical protein